MSYIVNIRNAEETDKELDILLIPNEIYDLTINRETFKIQEYFINHPKLLLSFVGFNSKLKHADYLLSQRKCGCFYTMPWKTKYAADNNLSKTILLFNQQTKLYNYMIRYWYPNKDISNLRYLSSISLDIINLFKRFNYNLSNNLDSLELLNKKYIQNKFNNIREVIVYFNNIKKT